MQLFDRNMTAGIVLAENLPESVLLAAKDLQRDLRRLSGQEDGFAITRDPGGAECICVGILPSGEAESYRICVEKDKVEIQGADARGAVYGIYRFCQEYLGILPVSRLAFTKS